MTQTETRALNPSEFQKRLHHEIPISSHMKIEVLEVSVDRARVRAPLAPNINHKSTAFGGSVNAVAVASCWSLITSYVEIQGLDADYIVIQDSEILYLNPIAADFQAEAVWESEDSRVKFLETLKKKGRARATLLSTVTEVPGAAKSSEAVSDGARLRARFAAQLKR